MKEIKEIDVETLSLRFHQLAESLGNANTQLTSDFDEKILEGRAAPEGVDERTWEKFQARYSALKGQVNTFVRHYGARVVIKERAK